MATIEIDGKKVEVESGSMIIEAADKAGIYIPRFCYHKKLTIAANCRMCLVEVEKVGKPLPACATPVNDGMKVYTKSNKAHDAQKGVMEFLLINHPLDCPICDQGGECELQDLAMGFGRDNSLYSEGKRSIHDEDLGPLISTDMTRCIYCTRCVRFGQEVAGIRELGVTGRGEHSEITTYLKNGVKSEISANIIDLCPVGALTSKPYRFRGRSWEMKQTPSISPHDCLGSNIYMHSLRGKLKRVVPRDNEAINEAWIADRDRFSYLGLHTQDRLAVPMLKIDSRWEEVDWTTAFTAIAEKFKAVKEKFGAEQIAALISPSSSIEEQYLLQKLMRSNGSNNIDHRIHQLDFRDQADEALTPSVELDIQAIEQQQTIMLIGSRLQREQPLIAHRVRKASLDGAKVFTLNYMDYNYYFDVSAKDIVHPSEFAAQLAKLIASVDASADENIKKLAATYSGQADLQTMSQACKAQDNSLIILGAAACNHPDASLIKTLAYRFAELTNSKVIVLTEGGNATGAWLAGAVPHRQVGGEIVANAGLNAKQMIAEQLKAYVLYNIEPDVDCADAPEVLHALKQADFVIACSPYQTQMLLDHADVILPIVPFTETAGTYVNINALWQTIDAATEPFAEARPGWKVLRVLGNVLECEGFDFVNTQQIHAELKQKLATPTELQRKNNWVEPTMIKAALTRISDWPLYRIDNIVRRAQVLQIRPGNDKLGLFINQKTAAKHQLAADSKVTVKQMNTLTLPVLIDEKIPDDCVYVPNGFTEVAQLGPSFGAIEIIK